MKLLQVLILLLFTLPSFCQTTLEFKPDSDCGKDVSMVNSPTWNTGTTPISIPNPNSKWLRVEAWTANSNGSPEHDHRSIIDFEEIRTIASMNVTSATLILYAYPGFPYANGGQAEINTSEVYRITEDWLEDSVSWATQPDIDLNGVIEIPQNNNYDLIEVDVTNMVQTMIDNPTTSYGFLVRQKDEEPYGSMDFASSDFDDYEKTPELIIEGTDVEYITFDDIFPTTDTVLCDASSLTLDVQNDLAISYLWNDSTTTSINEFTENGTYWVQIKIGNCLTLSDTINIIFEDLEFQQDLFSAPDTIICDDASLILDVENSQATAYDWSDGSIGSSLEINETGTYWVNITLQDCINALDTIEVTFENCPTDCKVQLPNAFTPDEDGVNDLFIPVASETDCFSQYEMKIYNRWGEQVFNSQNATEGWDGKVDGKSAPSDVYVYLISYSTIFDSGTETVSGDITLIR